MKKLKKLGASLLALVMALAMVAPATAAENDLYALDTPSRVTLKTESDGHTFTVYQIFEAAPADASSLKENTIKWSSTVNPEALIKALQRTYDDIFDDVIDGNANSDATAQRVAKVLNENFTTPGSKYSKYEDNAALAQVIANSGAFSDKVVVQAGTNQDVMTGYCVMVDQPATGDPIYMLQVITAKSATGTPVVPITPKDSTSKVTKEVWDLSKGESGDWSDGAIYKGGDSIQFKLTATMPDDITSGKYSNTEEDTTKPSYWIVLHDIQSEYLTLDPSSIKVQVINGNNTQDLNADRYTLTTEGLTDGCTFEIKIDNVQMLEQAGPGARIQVTYNSTLSEDAPFGEEGIPNEVKGEDTNGDIPGEKVKVFRLEVTVDKVDGDGKPLNGAEFTLFETDDQGNATGAGTVLTATPVYVSPEGAEQTELPQGASVAEDGTVTLPEGWTSKNGSHFVLEDLEPGTYILRETVTPDGYNTADDIKLVISAETEETANSPEPGKLTVTVNQESTFTVTGGVVGGTVVNLQGIRLPETGGIGTTIFYILGGALAVGAVVLLITKRRVGSSDDE